MGSEGRAVRMLVDVDVDDLDRGVAFYTSALPLTVGRRLRDGMIELVGGAVPIYLLLQSDRSSPVPGASLQRDFSRHWTPVHLDFVVDDLEAAVARARAAGASVESAISSHAWGRMALLADPFGNGFCLLEFTARGYDAIAVADDD